MLGCDGSLRGKTSTKHVLAMRNLSQIYQVSRIDFEPGDVLEVFLLREPLEAPGLCLSKVALFVKSLSFAFGLLVELGETSLSCLTTPLTLGRGLVIFPPHKVWVHHEVLEALVFARVRRNPPIWTELDRAFRDSGQRISWVFLKMKLCGSHLCVGIFRGIESFQGFLGAKWILSIHWPLPHWFSAGLQIGEDGGHERLPAGGLWSNGHDRNAGGLSCRGESFVEATRGPGWSGGPFSFWSGKSGNQNTEVWWYRVFFESAGPFRVQRNRWPSLGCFAMEVHWAGEQVQSTA